MKTIAQDNYWQQKVYYNIDVSLDESEKTLTGKETSMVEVSLNGSLLLYGNIVVKDKQGNETRQSKVTPFCRSGSSSNKPYGDGSHAK